MAVVLFSAMRNEGPFLFDWIAYHKSIGFDRICIVTNDCTDGSYPLLKKLSDAGIIHHFDQTVPEDMSPQKSAVQMVHDLRYLVDGDWAIFLDADEYLNVKLADGRVSALVDYLEKRSVEGMLVNWRLFGDSGQDKFSGSYINNTFTRCEVESSYTQFKTFFKVGNLTNGFSPFLHRCQVVPGAAKLSSFIVGSGHELGASTNARARRRHQSWLENGDDAYAFLLDDEVGYDIAQINHYIVRDPLSFEMKKIRGRGHKQKINYSPRHTDDFYKENNKNETTDLSILRWEHAVENTKNELIAECDISGELQAIEDTYNANIQPKGNEPMPTDAALSPTDFPLSFPDKEQEFVRETYKIAQGIIEYGSGGSTRLAAELGIPCVSVESDARWAESLNNVLSATHVQPTAVAMHINIGATKEWGYPQTRRRSDQYWRYPMEVWDDPISTKVDTVLIDGRFRKACFAATLMNIKQETRVLFDDYRGRMIYHDVEVFAKPVRTVGRMAEFLVSPGLMTPQLFSTVIPWFADVR